MCRIILNVRLNSHKIVRSVFDLWFIKYGSYCLVAVFYTSRCRTREFWLPAGIGPLQAGVAFFVRNIRRVGQDRSGKVPSFVGPLPGLRRRRREREARAVLLSSAHDLRRKEFVALGPGRA